MPSSTTPCPLRLLFVPVLLFFQLEAPARAGTVLINFDDLSDSALVTAQYPGLTFENAIILSAGISLNEFEFPPRSGANILSDNGGPLSFTFTTPVMAVSGYFTYGLPLNLQAFSPTHTLLGTAASAFSSNMALSGDPGSTPNEMLILSFPSGIGSVTVTGDPLGGSFVLDDLNYTTADQAVPEAGTSLLFITGAGILFALGRTKLCKTRRGF